MRLKNCVILTYIDNAACSLVCTWSGFVTFFEIYFARIIIFQEAINNITSQLHIVYLKIGNMNFQILIYSVLHVNFFRLQ